MSPTQKMPLDDRLYIFRFEREREKKMHMQGFHDFSQCCLLNPCICIMHFLGFPINNKWSSSLFDILVLVSPNFLCMIL